MREVKGREIITVRSLPMSAFARIRTLAETVFVERLDKPINKGAEDNAHKAVLGHKAVESVFAEIDEISRRHPVSAHDEVQSEIPPETTNSTSPGGEEHLDLRSKALNLLEQEEIAQAKRHHPASRHL